MSDRMWRAVSVFRVLALGYAAVLIIADHNRYAHPAGGIAVLAVMAGWSALTIVAYARPGAGAGGSSSPMWRSPRR
jgi:hypothetical protein